MFTGGLSSLHYIVTVSPLWFPNDEYSQSSNTTSEVIQVEPGYPVNISVAVINPTINSSDWKKHPHIRRYFQELTSTCLNRGNNMTLYRIILIKHAHLTTSTSIYISSIVCVQISYIILNFFEILVVLHPPSPYVDCGHGLVTLFWQLSGLNHPFRTSKGIELEDVYAIGYCNLTNGSVYPVSML